MNAQMPTSSAAAVRTRPLGVTVLAIVAGIVGVLSILFNLILAPLSVFLRMVGGVGLPGASPLSTVIGLVTGVLALAFAFGAWKLRAWAWPLGMAFAGLSIVGAIIGLTSGSGFGAIVTAVIGVVVGLYLMMPAVKAAFGRS